VSLLFRVAVYLPVLFLIAIVIVGQHHSTAAATLRAAWPRTLRWVAWTAILVGVMLVCDLLLIGL
jgi:hypothetical protein